MKPLSGWIAWPCLGFTTGAFFGIFIGQNDFVNVYQSLIAGILALVGAGLTVAIVKKQIESHVKIEEQRTSREEEKLKFYAHTKFLIHANALFENTRHLKIFISDTYKATTGRKKGEPLPLMPAPPTFNDIFDQNLLLPNDKTSQQIRRILEILQIVYARLADLKHSTGMFEGTLLYVFEVEWTLNGLLKEARTTNSPKSINDDFREYLIQKVDFAVSTGLDETDKQSPLSICKAYLRAHAENNLIKL